MIKIVQGDLFTAEVDAYVNTVNTVGIMGKGIALQFKRNFTENFTAYSKACKAGSVEVGEMFIFDRGLVSQPNFIINFPTKKHWRSKSKLEYIRDGLDDLVDQINRLSIRSIAMPALGCSNGGLDWSDVEPLIREALEPIETLEVLLYAPRSDREPIKISKTKKAPKLTIRAALLLKAFDMYGASGYELGRTVAQKLAYFIQVLGKDMGLTFVKHQFGPYSESLTHFVESFEGHYIEGFGDRTQPSRMILLSGIIEAVDAVLEEDGSGEDKELIQAISVLIDGFETPYGMELLASLHWIATQEGASGSEIAREKLARWSSRKANKYPSHHIDVAWNHLQSLEQLHHGRVQDK